MKRNGPFCGEEKRFQGTLTRDEVALSLSDARKWRSKSELTCNSSKHACQNTYIRNIDIARPVHNVVYTHHRADLCRFGTRLRLWLLRATGCFEIHSNFALERRTTQLFLSSKGVVVRVAGILYLEYFGCFYLSNLLY